MRERKPDFQLTEDAAITIVETLGFDWDTRYFAKTPKEVCDKLGINRRTFNSIITTALFTKNATEAQQILRCRLTEAMGTICAVHDLDEY